MLREEVPEFLKRCNLAILAKILKYKEADILANPEYLQFFDEKVKRGTHSDELINLMFEKTIEEFPENIPHKDYMKEEDFIVENYTVKRYSYDVLLHLILQKFSWNQILTSDSDPSSSLQTLNLYLFYVLHKYSNPKKQDSTSE